MFLRCFEKTHEIFQGISLLDKSDDLKKSRKLNFIESKIAYIINDEYFHIINDVNSTIYKVVDWFP